MLTFIVKPKKSRFMRSKLLVIAGIICIVVSVYLTLLFYYILPKDDSINNVILHSMGGLPALIGLPFLIMGLKERARNKREKKMRLYILQTGISAKAIITFYDKNWTIRINYKYPYSVVEYTYKDQNGNKYRNRLNEFPTEAAIRSGFQAGVTIPIKFDREDSSKSIIVIDSL